MTELIFDINKDSPFDEWTTARLVEEIFLNLASVKEKISNNENQFITVPKYYRQAREKMYRIPIWRPTPPFIINISDLSKKAKEELDYYVIHDKNCLNYIIIQAVWHIFENLDFQYFHGSVARYLRVRIEE